MITNKATVCIPSRLDNIEYLVDLIKTIENQTIMPDQILIVASGRPLYELENSLKFLKSKISDNLNLEFIVSSEIGLFRARNIGIENCKSEIMIFGDDDDLWHKDKVKLILQAVEANKPCLVKHFHNSLKKESLISVPIKVKSKPNAFSVGFSNLIGGGSSISGSLDVFRALKFENYKNCEDWEFWIRSFMAGIKIIQINKELVTYRIHKNRMTSSFLSVYKFENIIRFRYFLKSSFFIFGILVGFLKSTLRTLIRIQIFLIKELFSIK